MPDLGAYLASVGGARWRWGAHDCCTFPADWRVLQRHPDPMARWRGTYDSEEGCTAILREAGGLLPLCIEAMGDPTDAAPVIGDVGVVTMLGHEAGAIWTGKRWAVRTERGWSAASLDPECVLGVWHG